MALIPDRNMSHEEFESTLVKQGYTSEHATEMSVLLGRFMLSNETLSALGYDPETWWDNKPTVDRLPTAFEHGDVADPPVHIGVRLHRSILK